MAFVRWRPTLTPLAHNDLLEITVWTDEHFGPLQADAYREVIIAALDELKFGPDLIGVRRREEVAPGLLSLHVARHGRHGRHLILFRVAPNGELVLEILRILHDQMDIVSHLPTP